MKNIFKIVVLLSLVTLVYTALPAKAEASTKSYCQSNYKVIYRSMASCMKAEEKAKTWLAGNPVPDDIYATCKRAAGESNTLLQDCVLSETYKRNARSLSPYSIRNSDAWYAATIRDRFPSLVRVCGASAPLKTFAVLPTDITKFDFSTSIVYRDMLPRLQVKGRVKIGPMPSAMHLKKKKGSGQYSLYLDAFLFSADGRVVDISSTEATTQLAAKGGTARFAFSIGEGYYFDRGGTILVVASGSPITSAYPDATCLLLGAKKITFKKK